MDLKQFSNDVNNLLDNHILGAINNSHVPDNDQLQEMLLFHHGWENEDKVAGAAGKRIRPLMLLLVVHSFEQNWKHALPAAAAVELLHNFSLIHDDIEDQSETRRGRETIWKKWGQAQAINTGDALFSIANLAILDLREDYGKKQVLAVSKVFLQACLNLTKGQFLDISFEQRNQISTDEYLTMINGKTAELLAVSCQMGAILANAPKAARKNIHKFGRNLGLAFQIKDDILGIWGDKDKIGKSSMSDLITGKKTLPVLFGLEQKGEFYKLYSTLKSDFSRKERVEELTEALSSSGAREHCETEVQRLTDKSLIGLEKALPSENRLLLKELASLLLNRDY